MYKYKMIVAVALTAGMMSVSVSADEATLKALEAQGVVLTESQANDIASVSCESGSKCTELVNKVAELVAANSEDDGVVANILAAAAKAHPALAMSFGDAAIKAAPDAAATIAAIMIETAPAAAGPATAGPGPATAGSSFSAIPAPPGGGGSSSPS